MKVLVTGGTGLVGSAIKEIRPDWIYIGSTEFGSLAKEEHVCQMYESVGSVDALSHQRAQEISDSGGTGSKFGLPGGAGVALCPGLRGTARPSRRPCWRRLG